MCGIVGYVGPDQALPIVLEGLGGWSTAATTRRASPSIDGGRLAVVKRAGQARRARGGARGGEPLAGHHGDGPHALGHPRRPHRPQRAPASGLHGRIAVIHNGIIENFQALRARLEKDGHALASETDTECVAHLIEEHVRDGARAGRRGSGDRARARGRLRARRVLGDEPGLIVGRRGLLAAHRGPRRRREAPRVRHPRRARADHHRDPGRGGAGRRGHARGRRRSPTSTGTPRHPEPIDGGAGTWRAPRRAGFEDFMLKEIHEQPAAIRDTLVGRVVRRPPDAGRAADRRRRPARGRQGLRGRVRDGVPLRAGGEVRDRALDAPAGRDRDRERVPLPRSGARRRHADARA